MTVIRHLGFSRHFPYNLLLLLLSGDNMLVMTSAVHGLG